MNLNLIDFEYFIETDINPFILFNQSGKIEYLNHSAEILLGYVSKKELYDIAWQMLLMILVLKLR